MNTKNVLEYQWPYLHSFLASSDFLEKSAKELGALSRKRCIDNASTLLRLTFAYGFCGLSLRQTAAWAEAAGVASVSDVALLKRFRSAADWLGFLLRTKLAEKATLPVNNSLQLHLVDATTVSRPGSSGTDWRIHLALALGKSTIDHIELTDARGGEKFQNFKFRQGDVVIADRGYAHRKGLFSVLQQNADFIIRIPWSNVPLQQPNHQRFDLFPFLRRLKEGQADQIHLLIKPDPAKQLPEIPVRLVAIRKSEPAAEYDRNNITRSRSKRGKVPDPRSLEAAAYLLLLTSLDDQTLPPNQVLDLYRFRWQIEIAFKRMKGLLEIDQLPAKDQSLARTFLFSKLLAALVLDDFTSAFLSISPWGFKIH